MKKLLLLFITFLIITFSNAQAIGDQFTDSDISYEIINDSPWEVEVTVSALANVIVPSSVVEPTGSNVCSVTAIGELAFNGNTTIVSIEIPSTVTSLLRRCFRGATSLTSVTFTGENNITLIGQQAFQNATGVTNGNEIISSVITMDNGAFSGGGLSGTLTTPASLTTLTGTAVFRNNSIVTADLSASVDLLNITGALLFENPTVTSFILPPNVQTMDSQVCNGCAITEINFPASLTSIGATSFATSTLTTVQVNSASVIAIEADTFNGISSDAKLYVPDAAAKAAYEADANWLAFFPATNIVIGNILAIKSVDHDLNWGMYPNPTEGIVSIINKKSVDTAVTVYDINGRILLEESITNSNSEINISDLASGMYIFKVKTDNGEIVKRILKK
ncbi:leucine-rich repeat protein [uncultured Polaribacter sp.]|uniref:leucine-rich repeat protein n=1 Tax=uncultured Polaribacter sp. TaxID=174711 RepID=UPI0026208499|nr:leucine-rich repeat protein [uncultured Polaribacter sp.]